MHILSQLPAMFRKPHINGKITNIYGGYATKWGLGIAYTLTRRYHKGFGADGDNVVLGMGYVDESEDNQKLKERGLHFHGEYCRKSDN